MSSLKIFLAATTFAALTASSGNAAFLDYTQVGTGKTTLDYDSIANPDKSGRTSAGVFTMTEVAGGNPASLGLGPSFAAFCLDLITTMSSGKKN